MPSPFPGVDPYIEDQHFWRDFHLRFLNYCCERIADELPPNYEARFDETIRFTETSEEEEEFKIPDLSVEQTGPSARKHVRDGNGSTLAPVLLALPLVEEVRERRIVILHRPGRKRVTVLEVLSPTNKRGDGFSAYLEKRVEVLTHRPRLNLVELDLLLEGRRLPMRKPLAPGDFYAFVSRADQRPQSEVYSWDIRVPLPTIPIPLRRPDGDVSLRLAELYELVYSRGRYERALDYRRPLRLPLAKPDQIWAKKLVKGVKT